MNKLSKFAIAAALVALTASTASAKVYATLDGVNITEKDFEMYQQMMPGFDPNKLTPQQLRGLVDEIINRKLIVKAAKARKLDTQKEYKIGLQLIQDNMLIDFWNRKILESNKAGNLSDAELRKIYNENKNSFVDQQVKARHILVNTENEAKNIIAELNKVRGNVENKFIELANSRSIEPAAKELKSGGDLGTFNPAQMVPEFSKAALALKPNTYTKTPVQTSFGWHVIYLNSKTEAKTIPFEQAKQMIMQDYQMKNAQDVIGKEIQKLRSAAKIEIK